MRQTIRCPIPFVLVLLICADWSYGQQAAAETPRVTAIADQFRIEIGGKEIVFPVQTRHGHRRLSIQNEGAYRCKVFKEILADGTVLRFGMGMT